MFVRCAACRDDIEAQWRIGWRDCVIPRVGTGDGAQARALNPKHLVLDYTWVRSASTVINIHGGYSRLMDFGDKQGFLVSELVLNCIS